MTKQPLLERLDAYAGALAVDYGAPQLPDNCWRCLHDALKEAAAELRQGTDIRSDREATIQAIAEALGVEHEPHQTFWERLAHTAQNARNDAARFEEVIDLYLTGGSVRYDEGDWIIEDIRRKRTTISSGGLSGLLDERMEEMNGTDSKAAG